MIYISLMPIIETDKTIEIRNKGNMIKFNTNEVFNLV